MDLTNILYFTLFICYAIFAHLYPQNRMYFVWLFAINCMIFGLYLIFSPTLPITYLYLILSLIYTISLIVFLKYNFNVILLVFIIGILLLLGIATYISRVVVGGDTESDASSSSSSTTPSRIHNLLSNISTYIPGLSQAFIGLTGLFLIGLVITSIILTQYYPSQYIVSALLFLSLFFIVIWFINLKTDGTTTDKNSVNPLHIINTFFSYNTLYFFILLCSVAFLFTIKYVKIPHINTLFTYGIIFSVIFGLKHFIFNTFIPPNILIVIILFIAIGVIYVSASSSLIPYSTQTIVLYSLFTMLCGLLSILFGHVSTYIPFALFVMSTIITIVFSISKYSINLDIPIYISIFGLLYFIINGLNHLESFKFNPSTNKYSLLLIYLIICGMSIYLYFFLSNKLTISDFKPNSTMLPFIITLIIFIAFSVILFYVNVDNNARSILVFWICLTILMSMYYFFNKSIYQKTNFMIIIYFIYYLICIFQFIFNIPSTTPKLPFILCILILILFIWYIQNFWDKLVGSEYGKTDVKKFQYIPENVIFYLTGGMIFFFWICSIVYYFTKNSSVETSDGFKSIQSNFTYLTTVMFLGILAMYYTYTIFKKGTVNHKIYLLLFVFILLYIIFKIVKGNTKASSSKETLLYEVIEYIPCLYDQSVSSVMQLPTTIKASSSSPTNVISLYVIIFIVICSVIYKYGYAYYKSLLYTPGHTLIGTTAIPINNPSTILTYDALQNIGFNPYNFGVSFQLYLYPIPSNNTDFTIFTFSNYLYIQYNPYLNHITMWKNSNTSSTTNTEPILIYRQINVPLQKWIKYEINFINGSCDVFINNTLTTSRNNITFTDNIKSDVIVGTFDYGNSIVQGKINNLILYNSPLNMFQISMIK